MSVETPIIVETPVIKPARFFRSRACIVELMRQAAAAHSFQHPGYASQAQLPSAAGGYPTIDSLRSKLANALLQTKAPVPAAQPQVNMTD